MNDKQSRPLQKEWLFASAFLFLSMMVMPPVPEPSVWSAIAVSAALSGLFFGFAVMIAFYRLTVDRRRKPRCEFSPSSPECIAAQREPSRQVWKGEAAAEAQDAVARERGGSLRANNGNGGGQKHKQSGQKNGYRGNGKQGARP